MSKGRYARSYKARADLRKRKIAEYAFRECCICFEVLDPNVEWYTDPADGKRKRHPMSMELDEIVPVAKGGDELSYANTRCIHRRCNQARGCGSDAQARERLLRKLGASASPRLRAAVEAERARGAPGAPGSAPAQSAPGAGPLGASGTRAAPRPEPARSRPSQAWL